MPAPKKISCAQCRIAKTRCSLALPHCSRCLQRGLRCNYGDAKHARSGVNMPRSREKDASSDGSFVKSTRSVELKSLQSKTTSSGPGEELMSNVSLLPYESDSGIVSAGLDWLATEPVLLAGDARTESTLDLPSTTHQKDVILFPSFLEQLHQNPSNSEQFHPWSSTAIDTLASVGDNIEESTLFAEPILVQRSKSPPIDTSSMWSIFQEPPKHYPGILQRHKTFAAGRLLTAKHILSILNSFPEMLLNYSTLPDFIHPQAAIDPRSYSCEGDETQQLREPLANCVSLVHMFRGKTAASSPFVWRTIFSEQHRLYTEFNVYDRHDMLAALQAISIYILLQASESTHDELQCIRLIVSMGEISLKLVECGYQCDAEKRGLVPTWEEWSYYESLRRSVLVLFMIGMLFDINIGFFESKPACSGFSQCSLPCIKELWQAKSRSDWESKYRRYLSNRTTKDMLTFSILSNAQDPSKFTMAMDYLDDLSAWSSGLDEIGTMMMMAALAHVS